MTGDEVFDTIAHEMTALDGVSRNHRGSLIVSGSSSGAVRAMTSGGQVVVKLDPMRTAALVDASVGTHYKGQKNAWLQLPADLDFDHVRGLILEALTA